MNRFYEMGMEMTTTLGMENNRVRRYWIAYEENRFSTCRVLYDIFKKSL